MRHFVWFVLVTALARDNTRCHAPARCLAERGRRRHSLGRKGYFDDLPERRGGEASQPRVGGDRAKPATQVGSGLATDENRTAACISSVNRARRTPSRD